MFYPIIAVLFMNQALAGLPSDFENKVQTLIDKNLAENRFVGVSIGIVTPEKTLQFHRGSINLTGDRTPDEKTIYEIGSISKTFTRLLFADQTDIDLNEKIDNYLPVGVRAPKPGGESLTFLNLLTHTSFLVSVPCTVRSGSESLKCFGFDPDSNNPYQNTTRSLLYDFVTEYSYTTEEFPFKKPGLTYTYSNVGMGLLGELLSEKESTTYPELLKRKILNRLGMNSTYVGDDVPSSLEITKVYSKKSDSWNETSLWTLPGLAGAGGIRSNLEDMLKYLKANMGLLSSTLDPAIVRGQTFLPEATKLANSNICLPGENPEETFCNTSEDYYYVAWPGYKPGTYFFHAGETGGSQSMIMFSQRKSYGVIILSNSSGESHYPNDLALCLMQMAGEMEPDHDYCSAL